MTLNSWNEVLVNRFDGPHALLDCLRDYLNNLPNGPRQPKLRVRCFCHNRAQFIAQRVEEVIDTAQNLLLSRLNHRYLIQVQQHYHVLELVPGQVNHVALATCRRCSITWAKSWRATARCTWTRWRWKTMTWR